ncbi:UNVERIFIED_CONTAM: putative mitochondrial protein [Sesamum latifolium]|uniref:Mitochondrial protein n=1 Tax=Sesamum latifolium TaxID=2727402 RepID=A0AAW2X893_9LAMI
MDFTVLRNEEQFLHLQLQVPFSSDSILITVVYGKCDRVAREAIWDFMREVADQTKPWYIGGDFNSVVSISERSNGVYPSHHSIEEFSDTIFYCGLIDLGFEGSQFTWTDHRLWQRLDRVRTSATAGPSTFRFQNMWLRHPDFMEVVRLNWSFPAVGVGMAKLGVKLKRLKHKLKDWNKTVFGDIFTNLKVAEEAVVQAERNFDAMPTDDNLINMNRAQSSMPLLQNVPRLVSSEQGEALYQPTNADEDFLSGSTLPLDFTATSIALIPKVKNPTQWRDYRPISLCNTTNKILTKLLNDRIKKILPDLIVPNQSGFVPSRQIHDNILLAQEVIHSISAHKSDWNVAFKLDMAKAYDRVDWDFLKMVLLQLGFPPQLIRLVSNCITNCWFLVLINGSLSGFFKSTRGLRQGDPLSPTLFVLAAEYFSRNLNRLMEIDKSLAFKGSQGISHLAYADDVLIFTNSREKSLQTVMEFLQEFERTSGQFISPEKSSFIVSPKAPMAVKRRIKRLTGFTLKTFPFIYLGAPIHVGRQKIEYSNRLIDGMSTKIGG